MPAGLSEFDIVVVGAGIQGLCVSHTFLTLNPSLKVLIVDDRASLGGVWSAEQLYPGLNTNHLQGWYEFSDFPILEADLGKHVLGAKGLLTGKIMNAYFTKYAEHFDLSSKIRLRTRVLKASHRESEKGQPWTVLLENEEESGEATQSAITCSKLIVATGQASQPLIPSFPNKHGFQGRILHTASLGRRANAILKDDSKRHITIVGGSKSAHDAVYMFASAGKHVTWIARRTGRGFIPMAKTYTQMGPWSVWLEGLLMTRSLSWFGPAPWSTGDGFGLIRWLLHSTTIGRWIVRGYWSGLTADSLAQSGILKNPKTKQLVPDESLMWCGTQANSLTYENDFYELVSGDNVEIIRKDISSLGSNTVILEDGLEVETDILLCATGYNFGPTFPIEPREKQIGFGMPVEPEQDDIHPMALSADAELFQRFPELKKGPVTSDRQPGLTPWRLWRFIAPPSQVCESSDRSVAFLNTIASYQTCLKCEITSLWAYAYLFDELDVKPESEAAVKYEATLWNRFGHWSRPMGMKGKIADFFMDAMPYYDLLLRDLGLRSWRKSSGFLGEVFGKWYEIKDYRGLVEEWKLSRQAKNKKAL